MSKPRNSKGFSLIELLLVVAIIGILSTTLIVAINPRRQFAKARDTERETDLVGILSTVQQYAAEHSGELPDTDGDSETNNFPATSTCIGTGLGCFDLAAAGEVGEELVPVYLLTMPVDPQDGDDTDTGYEIYVDANGHLIGTATSEISGVITVSR